MQIVSIGRYFVCKQCQGNGLHLREQQNNPLLCCYLELIRSKE